MFHVAPLTRFDAVAVRQAGHTAVVVSPQVPPSARQPAAEHVETAALAAAGRCAVVTLPAGAAVVLAEGGQPVHRIPPAFRPVPRMRPVLPRLTRPVAAAALTFLTAIPVGGAAAAGWHTWLTPPDPAPPIVAEPADPDRENTPADMPAGEPAPAEPAQPQPRQPVVPATTTTPVRTVASAESTATATAPPPPPPLVSTTTDVVDTATDVVDAAPAVEVDEDGITASPGELPIVPDEGTEVTVPVLDPRELPEQLPEELPGLDEAGLGEAVGAMQLLDSGELTADLEDLVGTEPDDQPNSGTE